MVDLYNKAQEGYDIVYTRRKKREFPFLKTLGARIYYTTVYQQKNVSTKTIPMETIPNSTTKKSYARFCVSPIDKK